MKQVIRKNQLKKQDVRKERWLKEYFEGDFKSKINAKLIC